MSLKMRMSIKDLQEDMLIGLKISGCDVICAMAIAAQLQNPEDMREMLFCYAPASGLKV